ncbi:MAG: hypothetical protein EZS28_023163 [Streblomastix strix]|uniref:Reverse transcriptase domain-containing protein n=1 Tax=Streblomastix strix TaxID=222440 RepID=A0A5J4VG16_9EUKA|nr:MAG: hypothetical protein EZS28_023163 [Streblomastix strix]
MKEIQIIRAEEHLATTEHSYGQQDSRGAPIGARLLLFLSEWQKLGAKAVIEQEQVSKLMEIVNQELKDHVIEKVSDNQVLFYNSIFCEQKKKGKWRKILDCLIFNRQIQVESFKIEGVRDQRLTPTRRLFDKLFLAFYFKKKSYWYRGMLFGVALAPRIFAMILKKVITEIRKQWKEIRITVYSDVILLQHQQSAVLQNATRQIKRYLKTLGWQIVEEKSTR